MKVIGNPGLIPVDKFHMVVILDIMLGLGATMEITTEDQILRFRRTVQAVPFEFRGMLYSKNYDAWSDDIDFDLAIDDNGIVVHQRMGDDVFWSRIPWREVKSIDKVVK